MAFVDQGYTGKKPALAIVTKCRSALKISRRG
jgi:hypothetical protein